MVTSGLAVDATVPNFPSLNDVEYEEDIHLKQLSVSIKNTSDAVLQVSLHYWIALHIYMQHISIVLRERGMF